MTNTYEQRDLEEKNESNIQLENVLHPFFTSNVDEFNTSMMRLKENNIFTLCDWKLLGEDDRKIFGPVVANIVAKFIDARSHLPTKHEQTNNTETNGEISSATIGRKRRKSAFPPQQHVQNTNPTTENVPNIGSRLRSDLRRGRTVTRDIYYREQVEDQLETSFSNRISFMKKGTDVILKSYTFVKNLGLDAKEYKEDMTGKSVILKRIECKTDESFNHVKKQIEALSTMRHDNIVRIYDVYWDTQNYYYTTPAFKHGNLYLLLKQYRKVGGFLEPSIVALMIVQLASAIHYLHNVPFIHRDITSDNIMVDILEKDNVRVVVDFGVVQERDFLVHGASRKFYTAPEQVLSTTTSSTAIDIWSLGIVFAQLLMHNDDTQLINSAMNLTTAYSIQEEDDVLFHVEQNILETVSDTGTYSVAHSHVSLVCNMIRKSSTNRINAQQVLDRSIYGLYETFSKIPFSVQSYSPIMRLPMPLIEMILDSDYFPIKESNLFQLVSRKDSEFLYQYIRMPLLEISFLYEWVAPLTLTSELLRDRYVETIEYNTFGVMLLDTIKDDKKRFKERIPYPDSTLYSRTPKTKFIVFQFQTYRPDSAKILHRGRGVEKLRNDFMDSFVFGDTPVVNDESSIYYWEIKLEKVAFDHSGIVIGAWTSKIDANVKGDRMQDCYGVSMNGKTIRGIKQVESFKPFKENDICTVCVDFSRAEISFYKNGKYLTALPLMLQDKVVYPCVFLCYKGDKVSITEAPCEKKKQKHGVFK